MMKILFNKKSQMTLLALILAFSLVFILNPFNVQVRAAEGVETDIIATSVAEDWFQVVEGEGTWTSTPEKVSVDAFGSAYALEGATYLTPKGTALGAYEFSTNIKITELNEVENPFVGIVPWFVDKDNYLFIQLKMTASGKYVLSPEEIADGYAIEQFIISGRYNGEGKYATSTSQQENTTFDSLTSVGAAKKNPTHAEGHNLTVRFENNGSTATFYKVTLYYEGVSVGSTSIYYYNALARTKAMGFMAQDVKAEFSRAKVDDFYATHNTAALARDWMEQNNYTYRVLNGIDPWTFNEDESVSFDTTPIKNGSKTVSEYKVSGSNIAGYDTNRGFTINPVATAENGLPQNYEVKGTFKVDEVKPYTDNRDYIFGYGLLAWYKDDQNFVDVTIRRSQTGLVLSPETKYELVLSGWIECSNALVGTNVYRLPDDFDVTEEHVLRVEKKSIGFFVYLDEATEPVLTKRVNGTDDNYYYGYEGYNVKYTASKLESKAIYSAYDEISVVDDEGEVWKTAGKSETAWTFTAGGVNLSARETTSALAKRSYLLGSSDISDKNVSIELDVKVTLGNEDQISELMLAPYLRDDNNYARIGLVWNDGKLYARIRTSTYLEEDEEAGRDPVLVLKEVEIATIDLADNITVKAEKIEETLALYVNEQLVYGKVIDGIAQNSKEFGIFAYNLDLEIDSIDTIGYKKYEPTMVGIWLTSGIKYNEWTIDENGYLIGDSTYTDELEKDTDDDDKNFALQENTLRDNYVLTTRMKVTAQTEAEDRLGLVLWYVDENNYLVFYLDHWRSDSSVPRTTLSGKIDGQYLPTRYNHGGWMPEGDQELEGGLTRTQMSQVTEWHTITVIKNGNTFECSIDGEYGKLTYTVAAGLPNVPEDTPIYSGIYVLNDEIVVSSYDVTAVGAVVPNTLPGTAGEPINQSVSAPTLSVYADDDFTDEFDNLTTSGDRDEDPDDEDPDDENPNEEDPKGTSPAQDIWYLLIGAGVIIAIIVVVILRKKSKKNEVKND